MASSRASSAASSRSVRVDSDKSIAHTAQLQAWISERMVRVIEAKSNAQLQETAAECDQLQGTERALSNRVSDLLYARALARRRRAAVASERWNNKIYLPLQDRLEGLVCDNADEWSLQRAQLHTQYLQVTNQRGYHPLDTYNPEDYCPEPRQRPSVQTAASTASVGSRDAEDALLLRCGTGRRYSAQDVGQMRLPPLPLIPLGRQATNWRAWRRMRLGDIDSPARRRSQARVWPESHLCELTEIR